MSIFHRNQEPRAPATFAVLRGDEFVTLTVDDFAEIQQTTDKLEMERLVDPGWLLLDESTVPGSEPGREEFVMRSPFFPGFSQAGFGSEAAKVAPIELPPEDVTVYTIGYLEGDAGSR